MTWRWCRHWLVPIVIWNGPVWILFGLVSWMGGDIRPLSVWVLIVVANVLGFIEGRWS